MQPGMSAAMTALGVIGLTAVLAFCGWATFREPWHVASRRAERRAWKHSAQVIQPAVLAAPGMPIESVTAEAAGSPESAGTEPTNIRHEAAPDDCLDAFGSLADESLRSTTGDVHVDVSAIKLITVEDFWLLVQAHRFLEADNRRLVISGADGPRRRALGVAQLAECIAPDEMNGAGESSAA